MTGDTFLSRLNGADREGAVTRLLSCCASRRWASEVAAGRPFDGIADLTARSDAVFAALEWADIREALDAHPRIGERAAGDTREAAWSRDEQAAATGGTDELRQANADYERRFGHIFLICATGLSSDTILAQARRRLGNTDAAERAEVREELRQIATLRLGKAE